MKPNASFLILSVALAFSVPVFGQGSVLFSNKGGGSVSRWVSYVDPTQISVPPSGGLVQLAYAPVGTPLDSNLSYSEAEWLAINAGWTLGPAAPFVEPKRQGHISTFNYQECRKALMANLNNQQRGCFLGAAGIPEARAAAQEA